MIKVTEAKNSLHIDRLAALAKLVLLQQDLQQLLTQVAEVTSEMLPAFGASVFLWDEREETYTVSSSTVPGQRPGEVLSAVRSQGGATRWIIDHREPLIVSDVATHQFGSGHMIEGHRLQAFVGFPLLDAGKVLGGSLRPRPAHPRLRSGRPRLPVDSGPTCRQRHQPSAAGP